MRNLSLIFAALLLMVAASCKKQLEEYNPSGKTAEAVYTTPAGFDALVSAAYGYQRMWYGKEEGYNMSEMGTDIWMSGAGDISPDLSQYLPSLQSNNGLLNIEWTALYAGVNLCNAGINRVGNSGMSPALMKQREAELRFLRAFYYWHIVETWGGVHFTTQETTSLITTANKTSVDTIYNQIFSDLKIAVSNLAPTTSDYGRVTRPAAMSFLARMYLTRGMNKEAAAMAAAVINGGYGYTLQPNYADLWKMTNNQNKEVVYAVNYANDLTLNDLSTSSFPVGHSRGSNNGHLHFIMKYDDLPRLFRITEYGRPFNRYMPTRSLLQLYSSADSRYEGSFQEVYNACTTTGGVSIPGDTAVIVTRTNFVKRPSATYRVYNINDIYNANGTVKDRLHYPTLTKFLDPTRGNFNEAQSAKDAFVIRFAELYLIASEAKMKLGELDSAAFYVNKIRTRAAKTGQLAAMQVTGTQVTLDFLLDERAREFAGEQMRWFDLKRTGKLLDRVKMLNPDIAPNIQPYQALRPIPQAQLNSVTNKNVFTQNPGYQ
ncbi:RagB/SusD family nutrient uptake outer membrane protein [Pedobacter sp.]|uniref:RagB/SusD family nutrient uptake outer membrane protein n=1 Tax=Pedobacter sp. TaxID=1411316 RepID=UPI003C51D395